MPWINLSYQRQELKDVASNLLTTWEARSVKPPGVITPSVSGLISGDKPLQKRGLELAKLWLKIFIPSKDSNLVAPTVLPSLVTMASIAHLGGLDQRPLFKKILSQPKPKDIFLASIHDLLRMYIYGLEWPGTNQGKGHSRQLKAYSKSIFTYSLDSAFALATCPDHPLWKKELMYWVVPLAMYWQKYHNKHVDEAVKAIGLGSFSLQETPIYERQTPIIDIITPFVEGDLNTYVGFDAVNIQDNHLRVYSWLGFSWMLPVVYGKDQWLAYNPIAQLKYGWELINQHLKDKDKARIQALRKANNVTYILVHDRKESSINDSHLANARAKFGVDIVVKDLLEI